MYDETRRAVRRALDIGKTLFTMGTPKFNELVAVTREIPSPTREEIRELKEQGLTFEEAVGTWLRQMYSSAAVNAGFTEKQGLAMLEYAALLKDLEQ